MKAQHGLKERENFLKYAGLVSTKMIFWFNSGNIRMQDFNTIKI